jgi:hypothetical protein
VPRIILLSGRSPIKHNKDFARHLLAILMGNAFLYTCFYILMKLVHRERLRAHTCLYAVGATAFWAVAIVFFLDARTKWSVSIYRQGI